MHDLEIQNIGGRVELSDVIARSVIFTNQESGTYLGPTSTLLLRRVSVGTPRSPPLLSITIWLN